MMCVYVQVVQSKRFFLLRQRFPSVSSQYVSQERRSDVLQILLFILAVFTVVTGTVICCFVYHIVSLVTEGPSV